MYTEENFNIEGAKSYFKNLYNTYILTKDMSLDRINNWIEALLICFNTYDKAPKFVLTRALYSDEESHLTHARFVIRPSTSYDLIIKDMREVITITGDSDFFNNLISSISDWFDSYTYYAQIEVNIGYLNMEMDKLKSKHNIDIGLKFTLGEGLQDISDTDILLGLNESVIKNISLFPLFSEEPIWREACEKEFVNILKECSKPYDIFKIKSNITKELGIYQRKSISKLIRQVVTRRIDYVRVGVGYSEDTNMFAVIKRDAVSDSELLKYNLNEVLISKNEDITNQEKKENMVNIVTYFKVSPFCKKTGVPLDINIRDFLEKTKVV